MKRLTETDKWSDPWFQSLKHGPKLMFIYLTDKCNEAGFYEENVAEACFQLNISDEQYQTALRGIERGIKRASGWVWIRNFLKHQQKIPLNQNNSEHKRIISLVAEQSERFSAFEEFNGFLSALKIVKTFNPKAKETAEELITQAKFSPAYDGLDVEKEWHKMEAWCRQRKLDPTAKRYINWLNRAEIPLENPPKTHQKPTVNPPKTQSDIAFSQLIQLFSGDWKAEKEKVINFYKQLDKIGVASLPFEERKIITEWMK